MAVLFGAVGSGAAAMADVELLNASPTIRPGTISGRQRGLHYRVATADRRAGHDPHVARRLGEQARAVIGGLAADVVTLALAAHIDAIAEATASSRQTGKSACRATARPTPRPSSSWRGQPERDPRLERPGAPRHPGDHAKPENLGRGTLELPRGLGLRPGQVQRRRGQDPGVHWRHLSQRADPRYRRAWLNHDLALRGLGDVLIAGRTRRSLSSGSSARTGSRSWSHPRASWPNPRSRS